LIVERWQVDGDAKWVISDSLSGWGTKKSSQAWMKELGIDLSPGKKDRAWGMEVNRILSSGLKEIPEELVAECWSQQDGSWDARGLYAFRDLGVIAGAAMTAMVTLEDCWAEIVPWSPDWHSQRMRLAEALGYRYDR